MDITDLNLFAWCVCLKHLGKTIMFLVVGAIIGLAVYATFSSALLPGIENGNAGAKFGYILLSIMYLTTVVMVLWSYIATMTTDPGTTPPGWHPFNLHNNNNNNLINPGAATVTQHLQDELDDLEAGGGENSENYLSSSSIHDPLLAIRLSDHFQAYTRLQQQNAAASLNPSDTPTLHTTTSFTAGIVNIGVEDDEEEQQQHLDPHYQAALAIMERPRWCKRCSAWKPPRSHHDSMTKRCVLKMDHYCVWVGNTVGLLNYKNFVLFLFWAFLGCFMSAALLIKPTIAFFSSRDPALRPMITSFVAFVFTAAFSLALLGFVVMHIRLVFINQSTIEAYEKRPLQPWPYDQGFEKNFIDVFGRKKKLWLVPIITDEHRRRLLAETLDTVGVRLPPVSVWQGEGGRSDCPAGGSAGSGGGNFSGALGNPGRAASPSDESVGSDLGMVLIERPTSS